MGLGQGHWIEAGANEDDFKTTPTAVISQQAVVNNKVQLTLLGHFRRGFMLPV